MEKIEQFFKQVAFIALPSTDGSLILDVPLYVKYKDVNPSGLSKSEEEVLGRISEIMIRRYESQLSQHFAKLKKQN
jgi:hypothetical protein